MQNLVYEWVDFSKFSQIWAKIGSNLRKFWKNRPILLKIWPKIGPIGIWMGHFFLKNWYLYRSTFKFCGGTSLPKPNLSYPPRIRSCNDPPFSMVKINIIWIWDTRNIYLHIIIWYKHKATVCCMVNSILKLGHVFMIINTGCVIKA